MGFVSCICLGCSAPSAPLATPSPTQTTVAALPAAETTLSDQVTLDQLLNWAERRLDLDRQAGQSDNGYFDLETWLTESKPGPARRAIEAMAMASTESGPKRLRLQARAMASIENWFGRYLPTLRTAFARPTFRFRGPPNFESWPLMLLPDLGLLRSMARAMGTEVLVELSDQQVEPALKDAMSVLALGSHISGQSPLMGQMVACEIGTSGHWDLLGVLGQCDANQVKLILEKLGKLYDPGDFNASMDFELALEIQTLRYLEKHPEALAKDPNLKKMSAEELAQEEKAYADYMLEVRPSWRAGRELSSEQLQDGLKRSVLTARMRPNVNLALQRQHVFRVRLEALKTVAALRLYALEHQGFPAKLAELVPAYLPVAPSLDYALKGKSYTLEARGLPEKLVPGGVIRY